MDVVSPVGAALGTPRIAIFGEVLFDRFPDGTEVLGGAPFNVAWNLRGLGHDPLLVSRVGDDELGGKVRAAMDAWGLDTAGLQVDPRRPTGTVEVTFVDGEPLYEIVPERAWDHIDAAEVPAAPDVVRLYHGTLAARGEASRAALRALRERLAVPVFLDVNLRAPWWELGSVVDLARGADDVKLNRDELAALVPVSGRARDQARALASEWGARRIVVTRGPHGALAFEEGREVGSVRPARRYPVKDPVGAGDAFASVLLLGGSSGWPLATTLRRAQELAGRVVGLRGATTPEREVYDRVRQAWSPR